MAAAFRFEGTYHRAFAAHQRGQVECMETAVALAADVPPAFARVRVADEPDGLRGEILDHETSGLERSQTRQVGFRRQLRRVREPTVDPGLDLGLPQFIPDRLRIA